jgi:dTDP-4-amino-4,6-dideoxygalactose transaminase
LLEKLAIFDDELEARRRIAAAYQARLSGVARLQRHLDDATSGVSYFSICVPNRDAVVGSLGTAGVPTAIYYSTPLHKMPAFSQFAPEDGLPATDKLAAEILAIPMHPYLTPDQIDYICAAVERAVLNS